MTDQSPEPRDPWAPPEQPAVDLGKTGPAPAAPGTWGPPGAAPAHEQQTVTGLPAAQPAPGPAPAASPYGPPPIPAPAPGPAGTPAYGYPAQPDPAGYGYPAGSGVPPGFQTGGHPGFVGYPGYPGYPGHPVSPYPARNGFGITALVLGIISVVGCVLLFGSVALGIAAVVFGALGQRRVNRGEATNGGMAVAGMILGSVGLMLGAVMTLLVFYGSSLDDTHDDDGPPSISRVDDQPRERV
ncbi:DUF4190 domain-containing protein [Streptomyces sp. NPDC101733]|uniref:DUF4190 domain-containing protein n=1 Tax=unclassified Streptomyces TaxID=2593676 RepID=UPI0038044625